MNIDKNIDKMTDLFFRLRVWASRMFSLLLFLLVFMFDGTFCTTFIHYNNEKDIK